MKADRKDADLEFLVEEVLLGFSRGRLTLLDAIDSLMILFWKHFNLSRGGKVLDYLEKWLIRSRRTSRLKPPRIKAENGLFIEFEAKVTRTAGKVVVIIPKAAVKALREQNALHRKVFVRIEYRSDS